MAIDCTSVRLRHVFVWCAIASHFILVTACNSAYQDAIDEFCLTKFKLDMEALDSHYWCSWDNTIQTYRELTNCTFMIALKMNCFWPNWPVEEFFVGIHRKYFQNCSLTGRLPEDPPKHILGPFIVVPILVTLLMTSLVVWRSKHSEGIV
uniref:Receptor activity-modifying protein 1 n=1 Tax=Paramormyrops kingsleyae TaxID=1676925 RepID=A0A3B3T1G6_9TELE|nr:receptor activity-modifying protein 1-like [Paramormyrops kingsleyae]